MNKLLKQEKNENQHVISCLSGNPAECKSLLNIIPLDSRVKPENDKEVGRSMVEMLGVLAVMGILSVAGIAGYNNAMNHHRANELLNEVQKRAVVVAAQAAQGRETFSISEFSQPNGYTFGVQKYGDKYFFLTLKNSDNKNIDHAVCLQMKNSTGSSSTIRKISTNCDMFYFNNDLSKEGVAYDDNIGAKSCQADEECDVITQFCSAGKCISRCAEGSFWSPIQTSASNCAKDLNSCKCRSLLNNINPVCTTNEECMAGSGCCLADELGTKRCVGGWSSYCPSVNKSCTSNTDCDTPNEFCSVASNEKSNTLNLGTCLKANIVKTGLILNGKEAIRSGHGLPSWWAANNFCKAQGKRMVDLSDLGFPKQKCTIGENCDIEQAEWEHITTKLVVKGFFWLADSYFNSDAYAFALATHTNKIGDLGRGKYTNGYAFCI